jgi:histidyl-tRNA synthetase
MKKIEARLLKGFRDFLPSDMLLRNEVIRIIRNVFETHGFLPLETPTLEHLDILSGKYGEEGDKLIFKFRDQGERDVAMRYDLTVPLARVIAQYRDIIKPFKRYQIQPVWRADKPQKGRFREFYQCDVDVLGTASVTADAEIISVIYHSLKALGFEEFLIKINHRKLLNALLKFAELGDDAILPLCRSIDKLDKIGIEDVKNELTSRGFRSEQTEKIFEVLSPGLGDGGFSLDETEKLLGAIPEGAEAINDLKEIISYITSMGVGGDFISFDLSLARGLDYYTGAVFETFVSKPKIGSITGGGRYDELVGMFINEEIPAVGTSLGLERIIDVVKEHELIAVPRTVTRALFANFGGSAGMEAMKIMSGLRSDGIQCEIYPEAIKLGKQFKYADKLGIPFVIIIGDDELAKSEAMVKNMRTGDQTGIKISELSVYILKYKD